MRKYGSAGFLDGYVAQLGVAAGAGDTAAVGRIEYRAVMGTDEPVVLIGQKAVRCEIQRPALVGTQIEPGAWCTLVTDGNQPDGLIAVFDLEFAVLSFGQVVGPAQEHCLTHGV